jgi:hypothetical protein
MPDTPISGFCPEILDGQMMPTRQAGYRSLIETGGALGGTNKCKPAGIVLGHVGIADVIALMSHYASMLITHAFCEMPAELTGIAR